MSIDRMTKARSGLLISQPFFGTLALSLELVEDPKCKTTVTNGRQLRFNPEWAAERPMPELEAAVAHQVMSCAFGHVFRREARDRKLWNEASDHAVNHELQSCGFTLPQGSLLDDQYKGMHAEAIYSLLKQQQEDEGNSQSPQQPQGGGGQSQPGAGKGQQSDQGQPQPGQGDPDDQGKPESSGAGEGATGAIEDAVDEEGETADEAEIAKQEEDWRTAMAQAAQVSKAAGNLMGSLDRAVQSALAPQVAWQEALQRYLKSRAKDDYNWSRPNRRFSNIVLPTLDSVHVGPIAIAIDVSGSITQKNIDEFMAEVLDIQAVVKPEELIIMMFDTQVRGEVLRIKGDEPVEIRTKGGGGTAFDDPVRRLELLEVEPEVLVYLTDLDSNCFPPEPRYPVLWVSTMREQAPFGDVIRMY